MTRPKKPPVPPDHAKVAQGAARAMREHVPPPASDGFDDGVEAHRTYRRMCPESEAGCDLGPYVEHDVPADLHERAQTIRFPAFWRPWAARQTPATLEAIDRVTRREMRSIVFREIVAENWKRMLWVGGLVGAAYQWGVEALTWIGAHLPAIKALWQALQHGPPT